VQYAQPWLKQTREKDSKYGVNEAKDEESHVKHMQWKDSLHLLALERDVMLELCILTCMFSPVLEGIKGSSQRNTILLKHVAEMQLNQDHLPCDPTHVL
jgi:hypothetical protein